MELESTLITSFVTLGIAAIIQILTVVQTNKTLQHQRKQSDIDRQFSAAEAKRIEWKNYLVMLMKQLIEAREEYERLLGAKEVDPERHAGIVGKAIAASSAVKDEVLQGYANNDLTPYFANKTNADGSVKDWRSRNRDAMQAAVQRLADIIRES